MSLCHDEDLGVEWYEKRSNALLVSVMNEGSLVGPLVAVVFGPQVCPQKMYPLLVMLR
jgi:hypothetical protein